MARQRLAWYRMDNVSFMYSSIQREEYSAVYRFSAIMAEDVDRECLQRAIDRALRRFPGFAVRIKRGMFWQYFEPNPSPGPFLKEDVSEPCRPFRFKEDGGWLIRFYLYERRISIEVFHALADGYGAMYFLRNLLAEYLRQRGIAVPPGGDIVDMDEPPKPEEWEDAYLRHAGRASRAIPLVKRAYQNLGTPEPFFTFHVTMGFVPLDKIKAVARGYGVSITEYLAAAIMKILLDKQRRERPFKERPVALGVPVNLRALFPTATLRNFIMNIQPVADPALGDYEFTELMSLVRHYLRLNSTRQVLGAALTRGVRLQYMPALGLIPSVLKDPIMALSYQIKGVTPFSATFTNPGAFELPETMRPHVLRMEAILGQATVPRPNVTTLSYNGTMMIAVSGTQAERDLERELFRFLVREGIPVHVESNRREEFPCPTV